MMDTRITGDFQMQVLGVGLWVVAIVKIMEILIRLYNIVVSFLGLFYVSCTR